MRPPELIVAAEWSANPPGRRMARAYHVDGERYVVCPPEPVGEPLTLIERLLASLPPRATVLIGFDFPIGLPRDYAAAARLTSFREALGLFGRGRWRGFYGVTDRPSLLQPFGPDSNRKHGLNRDQLAAALGLADRTGLYRLCDGGTDDRPPAEALFFTRFPKQVGRAAISGWRDVLAPRVEDIRLWPFDGDLVELLDKAGAVVAEIYPAEALGHLSIKLDRKANGGKEARDARSTAGRRLVGSHLPPSVDLTSAAREDLQGGCKSSDDFDAVVGLLSMTLVVQGRRAAAVPAAPAVRTVEGWILGQAWSEAEA